MDTMEVELPNGSCGDSLVLLRLVQAGRTLVFDAGDARRLAQRDLLRLTHVLVSHCHVDHFIGFDALVRPRVCRPDRLDAAGPAGFLDRLACRLGGYTWNLVAGNHFVVTGHEIRGESVAMARFDSGRGFEREDLPPRPASEIVLADDVISVRSASLDHHVESRAWAVDGKPRLSVSVAALAARGLSPGPWIAELKRAAEAGSDRGAPFAPPPLPAAPLGTWIDALLTTRPAERVAYVTDTVVDGATRPRIVALAAGADVLACEASFLDVDGVRAERTRHLTARQAGELAREAGVRRLLLFHVSDRYGGEVRAHVDEAQAAAGTAVEVEARAPSPVVED